MKEINNEQKSKSVYTFWFLCLFFLLLFSVSSGCLNSDGVSKKPAEIGEVEVYGSGEDLLLHFGLDLSKPVSDGFVFDEDVGVRQENGNIYVTVNRISERSFYDQIVHGPAGWGMILSVGKIKDYQDGKEHKLIINDGTSPIETVTFRYDGDFLVTYDMAPVETVRILQNGTQVYAVAEIMARHPVRQVIDEENITFTQSTDFKETVVYIPLNDVNASTGSPIHRFTENFILGNLSEMMDGAYRVSINNRETFFEIRDGILYSFHPAEVTAVRIITDASGISADYTVLVREDVDLMLESVTFSSNIQACPMYEVYVAEDVLRAENNVLPDRVEKSQSFWVASRDFNASEYVYDLDDSVYYVIVNGKEASFKIAGGKIMEIQNYTVSPAF